MQENQKIKEKKEIEFYFWIHAAFRRYVEVIMDLILMGLVLVSFILIIKTIYFLGMSLYGDTNIAHIISEIMFIFILAETVRLLIIYLESHRVALDAMVEIAIVSVIREIILKGFLHVEPILIATACLFILVLGLLLKFGGIRAEQEVYSSYKPFSTKKYI
jgi:uncharacterized membrane protein (DUF373 family)